MEASDPMRTRTRPPARLALAGVLVLLLTILSAPGQGLAQDGPDDGAADVAPGAAPAAEDARADLVRSRAAGALAPIVPDSELVLGPTTYGFDAQAFAEERGGYLAGHAELVDGELLTGGQIVQRVAEDYSLGPRTLLTLIEMDSGWVDAASPDDPSRALVGGGPGLYDGLVQAAEVLGRGFYGWRRGEREIRLADGRAVEVASPNAGSHALLGWLAREETAATFSGLETASRFYAVWTRLFGEEPLVFQTPASEAPPAPELRLPTADGELWYLVTGPHDPRGDVGLRAAVDFAPPPAGPPSCAPSPATVVASAAGTVLRSDARGVVIDLDEDGHEGSGWVLVYRHLDDWDRAEVGERVRSGDPIGHPSCRDDGVDQSRVSLARKLDGAWVDARSPEAPLKLGPWLVLPGASQGEGRLAAPGLPDRVAQPTKADAINGITALP